MSPTSGKQPQSGDGADGVFGVVTFDAPGDFAAVGQAERALAAAGFSVGSMQRGSPRGLMFGEYLIQKWRNLSREDASDLHGIVTGGRIGPVTATLWSHAPAEARSAFTRMADGAIPANDDPSEPVADVERAIDHLTRSFAEDAGERA